MAIVPLEKTEIRSTTFGSEAKRNVKRGLLSHVQQAVTGAQRSTSLNPRSYGLLLGVEL